MMEWIRPTMRGAARARMMHAWFWPALTFDGAAWLLVLFGILPVRAEREAFVLHATAFFGIDRIGPWTATLLPAAFGLGTLAANSVISIALFARHRALAYLVGAVTVAIEAFLLLGTIGLVRFNAF